MSKAIDLELHSRRQFLQLSGVTLLGISGLATGLPDLPLSQGRTLEALPVYRARHLRSPVVTQLWPDSIVAILGVSGAWYQVPDGYVPRSLVQPMMPFQPRTDEADPTIPFWAEVAGPVAPVRQWCAADAPFVTRIGHGGVARVIDSLPGEPGGPRWYGIASHAGDLLGWTQAVHWRSVNIEPVTAPGQTLHIDTQTLTLTAFGDSQAVLCAPVSIPGRIEAGTRVILERRMSHRPLYLPGEAQPFHGAPWNIQMSDNTELTGVYWHNRFGTIVAGPAIQTTPLLARWLYSWLGDDATIIVD